MIYMYEDILVPTDGSQGTRKAVQHAVDLAKTYDARIHALYVVNTSTYSTLPADANWESIIEALEQEGEESTQEVLDLARDEGVEVVTNVVEGVPHREILRYSDENDVDLIVMGTHGKTGIDRLLLGSVTEKVVRSSETPVLTVRMVNDD